MESLLYATPMHVEGNLCGYGRATFQGVRNIVEVRDAYIVDYHRRPRVIKVNLHAFRRNANRPEQSALSDSGVEVVDLIWRSNLPLIEIQSDEAERAVMLLPIQPNVHALHETHIDVEEEGLRGTIVGVRPRPGTLKVCRTN